MRTIAGHPQNVLNDILALDTFAGVNDLVVVHHTGSLSYFEFPLGMSSLPF